MNDEKSPFTSRAGIILAILLWIAVGGIVTFVFLFTHTGLIAF